MFSSSIIAALTVLSTLSMAAPTPACHDCLGPSGPQSLVNPVVNIEVVTSLGLDPNKTSYLVPTSINVPTPCYASDGVSRCTTSELILSTVANTTDTTYIECRVYEDFKATIGGTVFNQSMPVQISTNTDFVGSWLCYIV
ncbi:uncharacterized protein LY89DRAFT_730841 [Mollisia scopiformis]|uniref:Uncharacterized protein n=1 Tax=Mollisia scopiformis TaxID=149040 RepID=A0A194XKR7_MOLSC|nr:uncharacterized protein LY89DRAFT_730841 [Mollisia scopiformis]KUJ20825.1 hypothetical protein LY89DRAFT_730841 [Mollisia scopiformis]